VESWPFVVYLLLVVLIVGSMLALSYVLGQRHSDRATGSPYEGGIVSEGSTRVRISAQFYLIAVFFVVFDLETVFIVAWAVAILIAALAYLWREGALDWGSKQKKTSSGDRI
jgi:NADH-quinone oxidoreductase subunit A